jgi:uncharacterized membrane protein YfcA
MATGPLLWLMLVFFVTSSVSVITGSTSLITVPVMFQFGIEQRTAIATNMFVLIFLSIAGSLPFLRGKTTVADRRRLTRLVLLTLAGSLLGALVLLRVPQHSVSLIVSGAMIAVAIFSVVYRKSGTSEFTARPGSRGPRRLFFLPCAWASEGPFFIARALPTNSSDESIFKADNMAAHPPE